MILTDLQLELPEGCYGRIAPRSGLSLKHGVETGGKFTFSILVFSLK